MAMEAMRKYAAALYATLLESIKVEKKKDCFKENNGGNNPRRASSVPLTESRRG